MKKLIYIFPFIGFFFALTFALVFAESNEFRWGGPGYDPVLLNNKNNSRFAAKLNPKTKDTIEITVDSFESHAGIGFIRLTDQYNKYTDSTECWKTRKQPKAPSTCSFKLSTLAQLNGVVDMEVWGPDKTMILETDSFEMEELIKLK